MPFLEDIADYLTAQDVTLVQGTKLFIGELPDSPDEVVAIFQYPGNPPSNLGDNRSPGLQVRTRSDNYSDALQLLEDIYDILDPIGDEFKDDAPQGATINGTFYLDFITQQEALPIGEDSKGRPEFTQNYIVTYV